MCACVFKRGGKTSRPCGFTSVYHSEGKNTTSTLLPILLLSLSGQVWRHDNAARLKAMLFKFRVHLTDIKKERVRMLITANKNRVVRRRRRRKVFSPWLATWGELIDVERKRKPMRGGTGRRRLEGGRATRRGWRELSLTFCSAGVGMSYQPMRLLRIFGDEPTSSHSVASVGNSQKKKEKKRNTRNVTCHLKRILLFAVVLIHDTCEKKFRAKYSPSSLI